MSGKESALQTAIWHCKMSAMRSVRYLIVTFISISSLTWGQGGGATNSASGGAIPPTNSSTTNGSESTVLEIIKRVQPVYTMDAARKKLEGIVVIKAGVSPEGDVISLQTKSGDPILAKAAGDAVKRWKFKPFINNGAASVSTTLTFAFIYRDKDGDDLSVAQQTSLEPVTNPVVWVEGEVLRKHKVKDAVPQYPRLAMTARVQGVVVFFAVIGREGEVRHLQVLEGNSMLAPAAEEAVKQWRYRPYLLGGVPVEVQTQIIVNFTLGG